MGRPSCFYDIKNPEKLGMSIETFVAGAFNDRMPSLRYHTNDLFKKLQREGAWTSLGYNFNPKNWRRFIEGVAISGRQRNMNHHAFEASGAQITLPGLLLLDHEFMYPIGKIVSASVKGEQLKFTAELANGGAAFWIAQSWPMIVGRELTRISIGPIQSGAELCDGVYRRFALEEISVVQTGADQNARITKVWEKAPVMYLDGRPTQTVHWSE
jgi:hypothetical protein